MSGPSDAETPPPEARVRLDARAVLRAGLAFALAIGFWFAFAAPYERALAAGTGLLLRVVEHPAVTSLEAAAGEIRIDRTDFPPASPRPGLPAPDIHFNFVLLAALFALAPHPLRPGPFGRFWIAAVGLSVIHVVALLFQIESVYATSLGPWSRAHYGSLARNFWAAGFHFYQIAGRFAAPFALWWVLGRPEIDSLRKGKRRP